MKKRYNIKTCIAFAFACLVMSFSSWAQTTVTINAVGAAGSFRTGSVNAAGTKNDGNMVTINSTTNRGWAKFDLSTLPAGAVVSAVTCNFTTFTSTSSSALNNLYGFVGDPAAIAGATLYTNCASGASFNNTTWTANAANSKVLNATGVSFIQSNITSPDVCIGFVRASTNTYNIYGYPGTAAQQPQLVITYTVPAPCAGTPTPGTITGATTLCSGTGTTLTLSGASSGATGLSYQWASSTTAGGPYTTLLGTGLTQATGNLSATTYYIVTTTCSNSASSASTPEASITVNPLPAVTVTPTSASVCQPGATATPLSASGATTYAWSPASGLSSATGSTVNATPGSTTTYTVSGTDGNGCIGTATAAITVTETPGISSVTATPSSVCSGGSSQLQANAGLTTAYNVTSIPYVPTADPGGASIVTGDDVVSGAIAIPFGFNFYGITYTQLFAYTNGFVQFGTSSTSTTVYGQVLPSAAAPNNIIAGVFNDLIVSGAAAVRAYTTGTAPNRIFTIHYNNVPFYNVTGNTEWQIQLYETSNVIEIHVGDVTGASSTSANNAMGIENATGTAAVTPAGRNFVPWNVAPASPEAWRFSPSGGTLSYTWAPATFLSSTSIANPMATNITATTTYTVTADNGGCSSTSTVTITAGSALTTTNSTSPASGVVCAGTDVTLNSIPSGGGAPYTYAWSGPNGFTSTSQNPVITAITVAGTGTYTITVTDNCGATSTTTASVTVNPNPVVTASPSSATFCSNGTAVSLSASGAVSFAWLPAAGLSGTSGASVNASPASTTTYTVTGTDGNGCMGTATAAITATEAPSISNVTASPATLCAGGNSQLNSAAATTASYTLSNPAFSSQACLANPGPAGDDVIQGGNAIGFAFNYFGRTYTQFAISTNGNIQLGDGTGSAGNPAYSNAWADAPIPTATAPNNIVALAWDDWYTAAGDITWGTTGAAPNRKLVVCFNTTGRGGGSADTLNGQIVLEEMTNKIYLNVVKKGVQPANSSTQGIEDATGSAVSMAVAGRNNAAWSASNDTWVFSPGGGTITYAWSPATFLSDPTISNPMANGITSTTTYTITASNAGCSSTDTVSIMVNPTPSTPVSGGASICAGNTATLTAAGATGTIGWYDAVTGGTHVGSGSSFTTPVLTSTTVYYVQDSSAAGCVSTRGVVTVNVNPAPSVMAMASSNTVCAGTSVTLMGMGASTYTWDNGVTDGVAFTPTGTATYIVTGTDGNGCSATASTTVTVNPVPTQSLGPDVTQCGGTVTLDAANSGSTYMWSDMSTAQTLTVSSSGMYYVNVNNGLCSVNDTINVTINTLPAVTMAPFTIPVCNNQAAFPLTGGTPSGGMYSGTGVSAGSFDPITAGAGMYVITYTVTDVNSCSNSDTATITVDVCGGIASNGSGAEAISVYPNPTSGMVNITISNANFTQLTINIVDIRGKEVYNETDKNISSEYSKKIDLEGFAKGVYYIKLNTGNDLKVQKIIIH